MKPKSRNLRFSSSLAIAISLALGGSAWGAAKTWTGTTNGNLLTGTNWGGTAPVSGDSFTFTSATGLGGLLLNNNLTSGGFNVAGITFNAGSGAYVIGDGTAAANVGNTFVLTGNITNNSTNLQTINNPFSMTAVRSFTTTAGGGDLTLGGNISGTGGSVTKLGAGTLTLSGTNTHTGNTTVSAGSLIISGSHSGNGTITVSSGASMAISGTYSGNGAVTLNGGTLDLGNGTATGTLGSTVLTLNGGAFNYTRTGGSNTHTFTTTNINAVASTVSAVAGNTLNLGNVVRATGVTMDFSSVGAGIVATTTANVGGIMSGFTFGDTWAVGNGAGVAISGLGTYTQSSVAGATGANYTGNNIDVDSSEGALDAGITTNSLRFSAAGANTMTLTGANVITTGGILVGSGVGANLSTITGGTLAGAASKDLNIIQNNASGGLTIASDIVNNGGATALTKSGAGLLTLSGNNTFTGGLFINDAGEVRLNNAGALNSTAGSENAVTFGAGSTGTLSLNGNDMVIRSLATNATNAGAAIVQNDSGVNRTLTVGNSGNASGAFAGTIHDGAGVGTLALVKAGTGTLTLSGTNTYSGGTTVNAGTLAITSDANLGASSGDLTFAGNSTLNMNATLFSMNAGRTITINPGVTATFTSNNAGKTFEGSLEGSGTLFVSATTSFTFNNASNFTGSFRVATANNSGYGLDMYTLRDEAGDGTISLENGSFRWFGSGGTKTFDDRQFVLGSSSGGSIYNRSTDNSALVISTNLGQTGTGTRTLTLGGNNSASGTFSGNIGNNGGSAVSLTKTEGNIWALGGTNSYTGDTNLAASGTTGVLIFQGAQSLSSGTTLKFAQASSSVQSARFLDDGATPGIINFNRPIEHGGSNTVQNLNLFVGNNNTANGGSSSGTTIDRTIQVGDITHTSLAGDTNTWNLNATGANGYRLQTGTITLNNLVSRTAGSTTAYVLNPTTANMTVAAVTMAAGNAGAGVDGIPILRLAGTSLDNYVTGAISNSVTVGAEAVRLEKTDTSTWTLEGANSYTGTTTVSTGTLIAGTNSLVSTNGAFGNSSSEIAFGVANGATDAAILTGGAYTIGRDIRLLTNNTTDSGARVLTLGGNTADNSEFSGNIILGTASQAGKGVTLTAASGGQVTFSGQIQNPASMDATAYTVTKSGLGKVILSNTNTYTGATNVNAGTLEIAATGSTDAGSAFTVTNTGTELIVNGTLGGSLLANSGTFVSGSGTIGGAATINGTYGPGNSPGTMTHLNTLTLAGTIIMEIDGVNGAGVTGGHDFVNLTGVGAAGVLTYGGAMTLDIGTIFGAGSYSWNLYDFASEESTFSTVSLADQYSGSLLDGDLDGVWDLTSGGNTWQFIESDGVLSLNVIPEPSVVLLGGLGALLMFRRRRA